MTREEALRKVKGYLTDCLPADCYREAEEIIEALKQETVLDKIRAEIESIERYGTVNGHDIWLRTPEEIKKEVLKILDKYKTESEDKE